MRKAKRISTLNFWTNNKNSYSGNLIDDRVNEAMSVTKILR